MKICIIASHLFSGGFTTSMLNMMDACLNRGVEVDLLFLESDKHQLQVDFRQELNLLTLDDCKIIPHSHKKIRKLRSFLTRLKIKVNRAKSTGLKQSMTETQLRYLYHVLNVLPSIDLGQYDAVISWEELLCDYFLAFNVRAKKKIAYNHPDYKLSYFNKSIDLGMVKAVDTVVGVSESTVQTLKQVFPKQADKMEYIKNPLNTKRIQEFANKTVEFKKNAVFTILTVARLDVYHKGFDRVVRVCKMLEDAGLNFDWYICGEGNDRSFIESMIDEWNVKHLHLLGNQTNPYAFMKQADVFVLLSNYEGKPVVVDEAMYLNLPCVVTNYASANEQIKDGFNGRVVSMDDQACFEAIKELMEDQSKLDQLRYELEIEKKEKYTEIDDFIKLIKS